VSGIVPSRLYRVKVFESRERFSWDGTNEGWIRDKRSDAILEHQINEWISETKALVVGTGPMNLVTHPTDKRTRYELRSVAIIYVPPVEQGDHVYGEQPKKQGQGQQVRQQPEPGSAMPTRRVSDGHLGGGGRSAGG